MRSHLNEAAVQHVAHLARLDISQEETALYVEQLSKVLDYMAQLNEAATQDVPPTAHALPLANVFREDQIRESWTSEQATANAPRHHQGFFKVPKVLDT